MAAAKETTLKDYIVSTLEQNTRGTQIGIYTIAGIGLAIAVAKIRPVSKFSRAQDIPKHFIKNKEPLRGRVVDFRTSRNSVTLYLDHRPHIRIPLWHSSKAPLPVQVWGIKPAGCNTLSWLQFVVADSEATVTPVRRENDKFIGQITVHIPVNDNSLDKMKKKKKSILTEDIDIAERLVELGMSEVTEEIAKQRIENGSWWTPWIKSDSYVGLLQDAQRKAMLKRNDYWRDLKLTVLHKLFSRPPKIAPSKSLIAA